MRGTDAEYEAALASLRAPRMGTELVGPLLYSLVRSTRAERVLEVGAGQTTLLLVKALADNLRDVTYERSRLASSQQRFDAEWLESEHAVRQNEQDVLAWLEADPPLVDPRYYERSYVPECISIDDASSPFSSAREVADAVGSVGLAHLLKLHHADFRQAVQTEDVRGALFDLAWFDCGGYEEYRDFLRLYWSRIKPDGGMIVLHYTLTVPTHERILDELEEDRRRGTRGPFEMLSVLEPHKLMQNSCTLVRRCAVPAPRFTVTRPISLERSGR